MPLFVFMHWLHSADQMVYRLGAACFTTTEFARVLYELREDRKHAMASAFAESKRSASRQELSSTVLNDKKEIASNKLRHTATVIEDCARHVIARPAFEAARIELLLIEHLIEEIRPLVFGSIPLTFHTCQKSENILALQWRAYVEFRTFNAFNADTLSDLLSRGVDVPDFTDVLDRDTFLHVFNTSEHESLTLAVMDRLYASAIQVLENSQELLSYSQALELGYDDSTFQGVLPTGIRTIEPIKDR